MVISPINIFVSIAHSSGMVGAFNCNVVLILFRVHLASFSVLTVRKTYISVSDGYRKTPTKLYFSVQMSKTALMSHALFLPTC